MKRKKSTRQKLIDDLDKVFSKLIRLRNEYVCESCGLDCSNNTGFMDCSHFIGRGNHHLRWNGENANAHCKKCHLNFTHRNWEHVRWFRENIGEGVEERLRELSNERSDAMMKHTINDLKDMLEHYKEELKKMEQKRKEGVTGWLDFVNYE